MNGTEWRCSFVERDILGRFSRFAIYRDWSGGTEFVKPDGTYLTVPPELLPDDDVLWKVPVDALAPLLGALSARLGAVEHPQQLRADYEHERARVDRFIENLLHPVLTMNPPPKDP